MKYIAVTNSLWKELNETRRLNEVRTMNDLIQMLVDNAKEN